MISLFAAALLVTNAHARGGEFGLLRETNAGAQAKDSIRALFESSWQMEMSMSFSMSMSMSMVYTNAPTPEPTLIGSTSPVSAPPTTTSLPTKSPSVLVPITTAPIVPSTTLFPIAVLVNDTVTAITPVFACGIDGIVWVSTPASATTTLNLTFSYLAQINATTLDDALLDALELLFLKSAVGAALGCNVTTKRRLLTEYKHIDSSTDILGACNATVTGTTCFWLETDLSVTVDDEINPVYGEYAAYGSIRSGMENDAYAKELDTLKKLTYLTPTLPNGTATEQPFAEARDAVDQSSGKTFSRWIVISGACLLVGGVAAILIIAGKKRSAARKELTEDESEVVSSGSETLDQAGDGSSA